MEKDFINKKVEVLVSFAADYNNDTPVPQMYYGTLLECDDKYLKIRNEACKCTDGDRNFYDVNGEFKEVIIAKNYVISIEI